MSQSMPPDPEVGVGPGGSVNDYRDHPMTTWNQPLRGESNFRDSSEPLFSMYCRAAEEEDNKMVERWQKDAEGIFFFTGLFSASVAALLTVSVQDLRPNSQDTSAFYLGNIYQVLADPNVTRSSTPYPVAEPPSFSPPRYAVWVNSLWFLSLAISLGSALWATSLQQCARRYLRRVQPTRYSLERRARVRAFFAEGADRMHIPWAVERLSMLLHLSLFLFFGGLAIFLFHVDREVFSCVFWWIGLFCLVYGLTNLVPIFQYTLCDLQNSPSSLTKLFGAIGAIGHIGGVEKAAEETVAKRSSEIDVQILDWTISTLGDDDTLKYVFEAIPGFFNSKLVRNPEDFPVELLHNFQDALRGFLGRTWSSNSVDDSEKVRRLEISLDAISQIGETRGWDVLHDVLSSQREDEGPRIIEVGHTLARYFINKYQNIPAFVQRIIAGILVNVRERDVSWVTLATQAFGLSERVVDLIYLGDDSVLLAILMHVTRQPQPQPRRSDDSNWEVLKALSKFDIRDTLPRLQHDFCALWNEIVQEARNQRPYSDFVNILKAIRHLYIALHQGTDSAPTAYYASTDSLDSILRQPSSYPICNLASHRPDSTPLALLPLPTHPDNPSDASSHPPTDGGNTAPRQIEQANNVPSSSNPTATSENGATSHSPDITPPINPDGSSSRLAGGSSTAVVAAPQDITSTTMISYRSHLPDGIEQQESDIVAPSAESGTALGPIPTSLAPTPSESYDALVATVSDSSHFAHPFIGSSIPASRPTCSAGLRARGLVNTRNICFANAVLQLLVYSPPFWNLFKELVDLKGKRGAGVSETGGATPLVDATVRFFKEFTVQEESPSTQRQSQLAAGGTSRADKAKKDDNVVDSFEPTYLYDAMKEKRQLKPLLDGQQQDAEEFLSLYLDALDEELPTLLASSSHQCASAAVEVKERKVSQPDRYQSEVGGQGFVTDFVESPITRIFGGKFHSSVRAIVPTENWRSLHLDIQHDSIRTVQDALAHISQPRSVQVGVSRLGSASQRVLIEALPPILVLHLNRVRFDAAAGGMTKIRKTIQLAPELEFPFDIMVPNAQRPSEPPRYKLYGVLYHHGESAGSGHYTVDVLHPNGDGDTGEEVWLHIDNEAVSPIRHEDVFREHSTERYMMSAFTLHPEDAL